MKSYVEHANITVIDAEHSVGLLLAALPDWSIRGEGRTDDWFGKPMRWYHVGTEESYITIQDGGEGEAGTWQQPWIGVKHIGIVVDDLKKTISRLEDAGYPLDHMGGKHPYRQSAYFQDKHHVQFEFVEYFSELATERNDYQL
ncbi:VOC family protein [Vibrio maritimus]